jgi:hypothetical protein
MKEQSAFYGVLLAADVSAVPLCVRGLDLRLHDVQMDAATARAAKRPIFRLGFSAEDPHDGKAAVAFRAVGAHRSYRPRSGSVLWHGRSSSWQLIGACGWSGRRPAMLEAVDMLLGMRDRRILVEPGKADFEGGKRAAVYDDGQVVRTADPGVPQTPTGLEGLDVVTVVKMCHGAPPPITAGATDHKSRENFVKRFTFPVLFCGTACPAPPEPPPHA